jgi:hypothetical protein
MVISSMPSLYPYSHNNLPGCLPCLLSHNGKLFSIPSANSNKLAMEAQSITLRKIVRTHLGSVGRSSLLHYWSQPWGTMPIHLLLYHCQSDLSKAQLRSYFPTQKFSSVPRYLASKTQALLHIFMYCLPRIQHLYLTASPTFYVPYEINYCFLALLHFLHSLSLYS